MQSLSDIGLVQTRDKQTWNLLISSFNENKQGKIVQD